MKGLTGLVTECILLPMLAESSKLVVADTQIARERVVGRVIFLLALTILLVAGLRNLADPWERGTRGGNGAQYSDGAVTHTLRYGLGVTSGMPAFISEVDGELVRDVNWHHPPGYWLYLSGAAWLFGHHTWVLRLAHLLLFVPGLLALFAFVRRNCGELPASVVALIFATTPLVAYFGPMVVQDGAALSLGLLTLWRFQVHVETRTWRSWLAVAACFFVTASIDFPGYWWGPAMMVLALGSTNRWRDAKSVLSLFPVALVAFTVLALHYGQLFGGAFGYVKALLATVGQEGDADFSAQRISAAVQRLAFQYGNWPLLVWAIVGLGSLICLPRGREWRLAWLGLALIVPGVLNCGLMFHHALGHVFWSMHGFAGLACFAAIPFLVGWRRIRLSVGGRRLLAATCILGTGLLVVAGATCSHQLITRFEARETATGTAIMKALPLLTGCARTLTSLPPTPQSFFGHTQVFGGIDTPEKVDISLALGRQLNVRGEVGFVVAPEHIGTSLTEHLDGIAKMGLIDGLGVYRIRL